MSNPRLPSVRLVDLLPWQRAFCMFLLLSTVGWMLSKGGLKARPFPVLLPVVVVWDSTTPFFFPPLNFFQLRALMNIECFLRFFSSAFFSTSR